jgi:long-chain acyl-CoA synthetase
VAAEKIENVLQGSSLVASAFVYGDSYQSYLVAVLVVDQDAFAAQFGTASSSSSSSSSLAAACADGSSKLRAAVAADVLRLSAAAQLAGFEVVKQFHLEAAPFSVEAGLLTPTFKLKRHAVQAHYQTTIDALYKLPLASSGRASL